MIGENDIALHWQVIMILKCNIAHDGRQHAESSDSFEEKAITKSGRSYKDAVGPHSRWQEYKEVVGGMGGVGHYVGGLSDTLCLYTVYQTLSWTVMISYQLGLLEVVMGIFFFYFFFSNILWTT